MPKDAYYFTHDANARNDTRIVLLRAKYGFEGYGWYWAVIEMMRESDGYMLRRGPFLFPGLALSLSAEQKTIEAFFSDCLDLGLFEIEDDSFMSPSLTRRMRKLKELQKKRSEAGKRGAIKRWQTHGKQIANAWQTDSKPIAFNLSNLSNLSKTEKEQTLDHRGVKNQDDSFSRWWKSYPRKIGKAAAMKAWARCVRGKVEISKMLEALEKQKSSEQWTKNGGQFIPHPTTYLNQGRWDDEIQGKPNRKIMGSRSGENLDEKYGSLSK